MADSVSPVHPKPRRRRGRRVLVILAGFILLLLVLVLLAPTLISAGIGQGLIRDAAAGSVNGTLEIKSMRLGWFSGQALDGVRIVDASGAEAANVSITVNNSLLSLAMGSAGKATPIDVTISGSVAGQLREDGSISLADLIKSDPAKPKKPKPASNKPKTPLRDAIPRAVITIAALDVTLDDVKYAQSLKIDSLNGKIAYTDSEQPITLDLHGKTAANIAGKTGSGAIDITGQADNLFAQDGSITLRGAAVKLDVQASGVPLPMTIQDRHAMLQAFALNIASDDVTDRIALTITGDAQIEGAAKPTHIKVDGSIGKALTGQGELSLRAASAHLMAEIANLPVNAPDVRGEMSLLTATIVSEDLTKRLEIAANGAGMINGNQPSDLSANLALVEPFASDGTFTFSLDNLTGSVSGTRVPTSLAQPALAGLGVDAQRDLGPTVDLEAFFPGGLAAGGGDLMASATAAKAKVEVEAKINADESITGSKLALSLRKADSALIAALTKNSVITDRALDIEINLSAFHVPAPDATTNAIALGQVAATGTLAISGPSGVRVGGDLPGPNATSHPATSAPAASPPVPSIPLERIDLAFASPGLAQFITLKGNALLGGGTIVVDERITSLIDAHGALAAANARPEGSLKIENLPAETILAFVPPEHVDLVAQIIGEQMNAELRTLPSDAGLNANLTARTRAVTANLEILGRDDHSLQVNSAVFDATVTPELAAIAQKASETPVVLGGPAKVHVDLKPMVLPMGAAADVLSANFSGRVTLTDAIVQKAPGIADTLAIPSLEAELTLLRQADTLTAIIANGSATLKRGSARNDIARLTINGSIAMTGSEISPDLDVNFADLNTRQAEAVLGLAPGTIANWTGDKGGLDVRVESATDGLVATAKPTMPNVQGTFTASMKNDMVAITAETSRLVLGKDALQSRLNPPPPEASNAKAVAAAQDTLITVDADVPMQVAISRCEFPMQMLTGEPFDPASVHVDVRMTGGPLKTSTKDGVRSTLSDLDLNLKAADISKGVTFGLTSTTEAIVPAPPPPAPAQAQPAPSKDVAASAPPAKPPEATTPEERREARREERRAEREATAQPVAPAPTPAANPVPAAPSSPLPGSLNVTGKLVDVINSEGVLALGHGRMQLNAKADNVPTAVADALGDMQGLLVAAVGSQMNAEFVADDFSASTGTLNAKINTTNGRLSALLRGRESSFRVNKNDPVRAELDITLPLRERLLMKIHPILADVRTTEQPLRIEIPTALAAMPADISKLRAEINITVGKVDLDSGSTTLKILNFFGAGDRSVIPGEIEPIRAQIRNGIVTYDKFSVHIDKYTLNYSGQIDLVKDEVNLRTEIPLKALNDQFPQLRDYAATIVVPLVTRGKFGALKTTIDPDFDLAKAALNAGFKGTLGNILGGDAGGLLDQILNKDKNKQPDASGTPPSTDRPAKRDRPTTQPR